MPIARPEVLADGFTLPESPRWHDGALWFSDILAGRVHRLVPGGDLETIIELVRPSGLGFLPDGDVLVVDMGGRALHRLHGTTVVHTVDLSDLAAGEVNDMAVDASGRAYIGDTGQTIDRTFDQGAGAPSGQVIVVEPDGTARVGGGGLVVPNGIDVSPDGTTLVVAECFGPMQLTAFGIAADGSLTDQRPLVQLSDGAPDGLCFDAEGAVWLAVHPRPGAAPHPSPPAERCTGSEFVRIVDGVIADRIPIEGRWPLACAIGGDDGHTLFLCTAEPPQAGDARAMHHGWIETVTVDVPAPAR